MLHFAILTCYSPDIIGRIRETEVFKGSKHGEPNHIIMNEVLV